MSSARERSTMDDRRWTIEGVAPSDEVIHGRRVGQEQRAVHVVAAQPVLKDKLRMNEQQEDGDDPADGSSNPSSDGEHVEERDTAHQRIPEAQTEFVRRQEAPVNRQADDPELERWLFEPHLGVAGDAFRSEPISVAKHRLNAEGVDALVAIEVQATEAHEQRRAEEDHDQRHPQPRRLPDALNRRRNRRDWRRRGHQWLRGYPVRSRSMTRPRCGP
jgi:hypothetical protein